MPSTTTPPSNESPTQTPAEAAHSEREATATVPAAFRLTETPTLLKLSLGFIGIQFAWMMQIALSQRVLEPLGADPFWYGLIWSAGPISGLLVQPIVGAVSDHTWTPMGRRRPFILGGALLAALALFVFPLSPALWVAAICILLIDVCVNMVQGPYRAIVPDLVEPSRVALTNSFVNFAIGTGAVCALLFPILADKLGIIQMSVAQKFFMAAVALLAFIWIGVGRLKEYARPADLAEENTNRGVLQNAWKGFSEIGESFKAFFRANREIHKLCGVQFLTWLGLMCMFIYFTPYVIHNVYTLPELTDPQVKWERQYLETSKQVISQFKLNEQAVTLTGVQQLVSQNAGLREAYDDLSATAPRAIAYRVTPDSLIKGTVAFQDRTVTTALPEKLTPIEKTIQAARKLPQEIQLGVRTLMVRLERQARMIQLEHEAEQQVSWGYIAFNGMALLLSIPFGMLMTRVGKKPVYTGSLLCMAAAFFVAPFLTAGWQAIAMMALAGVAWATVLSVPFSLLNDHVPEGEEGIMMGMFNLFIAAPQLVVTTVVALIINQSMVMTPFGAAHQWSTAFLIGGVSVLLAVFALQWVTEVKHNHQA